MTSFFELDIGPRTQKEPCLVSRAPFYPRGPANKHLFLANSSQLKIFGREPKNQPISRFENQSSPNPGWGGGFEANGMVRGTTGGKAPQTTILSLFLIDEEEMQNLEFWDTCFMVSPKKKLGETIPSKNKFHFWLDATNPPGKKGSTFRKILGGKHIVGGCSQWERECDSLRPVSQVCIRPVVDVSSSPNGKLAEPATEPPLPGA